MFPTRGAPRASRSLTAERLGDRRDKLARDSDAGGLEMPAVSTQGLGLLGGWGPLSRSSLDGGDRG